MWYIWCSSADIEFQKRQGCTTDYEALLQEFAASPKFNTTFPWWIGFRIKTCLNYWLVCFSAIHRVSKLWAIFLPRTSSLLNDNKINRETHKRGLKLIYQKTILLLLMVKILLLVADLYKRAGSAPWLVSYGGPTTWYLIGTGCRETGDDNVGMWQCCEMDLKSNLHDPAPLLKWNRGVVGTEEVDKWERGLIKGEWLLQL